MEKQLYNAQQDWNQALTPSSQDFNRLYGRIMNSLPGSSHSARKGRLLITTLLTSAIIGIAIFLALPVTNKNEGPTPADHTRQTDTASLFIPGVGGDVAWWMEKQKAAQDADEKTISGFMVALLQGKIGAYQFGPAEIDQFIDPQHNDMKKTLKGYDEPSGPKIKQFTFSNQVKDETGITYNFTYTGVSTNQGPAFKGNMRLHISSKNHIIDLLIPTDTMPPLGIIYNADGYLDSKVANGWRGIVDGQYMEVYAGAIAKDMKQGMVILVEHSTSWDPNYGITNYSFKTPSKHGMIAIIREENLKLTLQATDGTHFIFDIKKRAYSSN